MRLWRRLLYHKSEALHVSHHGCNLLLAVLLDLLDLLLAGMYRSLPLGPLCCKLGLQYLIKKLEYKANIPKQTYITNLYCLQQAL